MRGNLCDRPSRFEDHQSSHLLPNFLGAIWTYGKKLAPIFPYLPPTLPHFTRVPQPLHPWIIPNSLGPPPPPRLLKLQQRVWIAIQGIRSKYPEIQGIIGGDTHMAHEKDTLSAMRSILDEWIANFRLAWQQSKE